MDLYGFISIYGFGLVFGFAFNSSRLTPEIELLYIKNAIRQGNAIYSCHIQGGFPLKFCFCYGPIMIARFHDHLA